ncbi:helix-turn-helix domain-containing protein [Teredinibacter turnerae]|uniref:helix-turn-helix domain-containing protein n=1 Tax=Teredinibacter turnerae TaxID=2426 RepID=UPI000372C710|nr:helix-turn-helix transcriptional regulator [Teredinibacter turnerae]
MDVIKFQGELNQFLNTSGVSQNTLAKQAGVSQSQISDWKNAAPKRFSRNPKKVMTFIENYRKSDAEQLPEEVVRVVRNFCAGDNERYAFLVRMIESLHPLVKRAHDGLSSK